MNKFKVGDKVRIIRKCEIGTIVNIANDDFDIFGASNLAYVTKIGKYTSCVYTVHDIELIEEAQEAKEILTEEEKEYLSNAIKPFRYRIRFISKGKYYREPLEFIEFIGEEVILSYLPEFKAGQYYKNMEVDKEYTLEELGL